MERALGLMCGAGVLPARMAEAARGRGWRVLAFAFHDAPGVRAWAESVVDASVIELGPVLGALQRDGVGAVLFSGTFSMPDIVRADATTADAVAWEVGRRAGSRIDARLAEAVIATLGSLGIEVLDQRPFVGDWLATAGCWTARRPTDAEWQDVRRGLDAARLAADAGIGQSVVVRHGVVTAVEAVEGTTEAILRGVRLGGGGTVVVKAVARSHDYRFDTPAIGPDTIQAAADGQAAVVAVEAGRVLLVDREATIAAADRAGVALVGVEDACPAGS
ncbi:MAG: UDP-2,3-diacylglucosamine diphosphatase LpxI [Candidatus Rokubacteria bacterium]|nr:UDP-2,3-diacylglucosamine diphosphatase LpxI [Candidatus Rokubacteria bacterium]MBI3827755.1 UDP-2,3-diacylglucosamine diphosphatase LpxI [Candidatus Rokubacteria bacterium]